MRLAFMIRSVGVLAVGGLVSAAVGGLAAGAAALATGSPRYTVPAVVSALIAANVFGAPTFVRWARRSTVR